MNHADLLRIIHEEACRTLSREDFDLCMRIAKRVASASPARCEDFAIAEVPRAEWEHPGWREFDVVYRGSRGERRVHGGMIKVVARMKHEDKDYALGEKVRDWLLASSTETTFDLQGAPAEQLYESTEYRRGRLDGYIKARAEHRELKERVTRALYAAKHFVANGIALGYIHMPDKDCPDPAHQTPKLIDDAIIALEKTGP